MRIDEELLARLDNARAALQDRDVYQTGYAVTLADIVEHGLLDELGWLERVYNRKRAFPLPSVVHKPARLLATRDHGKDHAMKPAKGV
jgi:hypothetical protein